MVLENILESSLNFNCFDEKVYNDVYNDKSELWKRLVYRVGQLNDKYICFNKAATLEKRREISATLLKNICKANSCIR